jgi:hydroxymethylglutaryl-CoA synthase
MESSSPTEWWTCSSRGCCRTEALPLPDPTPEEAAVQLIGIDALAIALPRRFVDIEDLARARGVDPAKYTVGLGAREMCVADPGEDTVSLAATAGRRVLDQAGVDPGELGLLVVGTETGVDHSKPVASFVHGLLDLPRSMRVYDTQHACYGGTAGLMAAVEWIASGAAGARKALVICSDIARYGLRTPGEPTQGAGAIALLVSADPSLVALDVGVSGTSSTHVHDFWRPLGRREAEVDGHYSVQCYLDAVSDAYRGWRTQAVARGWGPPDGLPSEGLAAISYHVPFCKMARKAHVQVRRCDVEDGGGTWGPDDEAAALASYLRQVEPTLGVCARVGNVYTGSLYFGLAGLLRTQAEALAGWRIGLFSYGSGCTSEFFSGVVAQGAADRIAQAQIDAHLGAREQVTVAEYEQILSLSASEPEASATLPGEFRFAGVLDHRRQYVGA